MPRVTFTRRAPAGNAACVPHNVTNRHASATTSRYSVKCLNHGAAFAVVFEVQTAAWRGRVVSKAVAGCAAVGGKVRQEAGRRKAGGSAHGVAVREF